MVPNTNRACSTIICRKIRHNNDALCHRQTDSRLRFTTKNFKLYFYHTCFNTVQVYRVGGVHRRDLRQAHSGRLHRWRVDGTLC